MLVVHLPDIGATQAPQPGKDRLMTRIFLTTLVASLGLISAAPAESIDPNDVTLQILQDSGSRTVETVSRTAVPAIPAGTAAEAGSDHAAQAQRYDYR